MSLWTLGFRLWSTLKTARLAAPGIVAGGLVLFAQGPTTLFWIITVVTGAVWFGARSVMTDLARREGAGKPATTTTQRGRR